MNTTDVAYGVIDRHGDSLKDYLFRVSVKALIVNEQDQVLIVREHGHDWWDLPGGGVDHGESIKEALTRELAEEVSFEGEFSQEVLVVEDPSYSINHKVYQIRVTFLIKTDNLRFKAGDDCEEIKFVDPGIFADSQLTNERKIFDYCQLAKK